MPSLCAHMILSACVLTVALPLRSHGHACSPCCHYLMPSPNLARIRGACRWGVELVREPSHPLPGTPAHTRTHAPMGPLLQVHSYAQHSACTTSPPPPPPPPHTLHVVHPHVTGLGGRVGGSIPSEVDANMGEVDPAGAACRMSLLHACPSFPPCAILTCTSNPLSLISTLGQHGCAVQSACMLSLTHTHACAHTAMWYFVQRCHNQSSPG